MGAGRLEKAGAPGWIQERLEATIRREEKPATFSAQKNDTPNPPKNKEARRENPKNKKSKVNLRRQ
jgi:hypothetical protein